MDSFQKTATYKYIVGIIVSIYNGDMEATDIIDVLVIPLSMIIKIFTVLLVVGIVVKIAYAIGKKIYDSLKFIFMLFTWSAKIVIFAIIVYFAMDLFTFATDWDMSETQFTIINTAKRIFFSGTHSVDQGFIAAYKDVYNGNWTTSFPVKFF